MPDLPGPYISFKEFVITNTGSLGLFLASHEWIISMTYIFCWAIAFLFIALSLFLLIKNLFFSVKEPSPTFNAAANYAQGNSGPVNQTILTEAPKKFSTTTVVGLWGELNVDNLATLYIVPPLEILKEKKKFDPASQEIALTLAKTTSRTVPTSDGRTEWKAPYNSSTDNVAFVRLVHDYVNGTTMSVAYLAEPSKTWNFKLNIKDTNEIKIGNKVFSVTLQDINLVGAAANNDYKYTFQIQEE